MTPAPAAATAATAALASSLTTRLPGASDLFGKAPSVQPSERLPDDDFFFKPSTETPSNDVEMDEGQAANVEEGDEEEIIEEGDEEEIIEEGDEEVMVEEDDGDHNQDGQNQGDGQEEEGGDNTEMREVSDDGEDNA